MKELIPQLQFTQQKRVAALLAISQLGYAHWLFENLYEAVVRVPERLANDYELGKDDPRLPSALSSGSPVCYYLPGVPVVIGATLSAVLAGWRQRNDCPWLASLAVSALFGGHRDGLASADRQPQALRRWPAPNAGRPGPFLTDLVSSERPPPIGRK